MVNEILIWVSAILGSVSLPSIVGMVLYLCLKKSFNKTINKLDVESIVDRKVEKAVERKVKNVTFTHNIQPICESELQKINEKSNEYIEASVIKIEKKLDKVINIQEKQAKYFDNSIGVSQESKDELKKAIEEAKIDVVEPVESVIEEEVVVVNTKTDTKKNKVSR